MFDFLKKNEILAEYSFVYPAKREYVGEVKQKITEICKEYNFIYKDLNNLLIVLDEVCSNIIRHAYKDSEGDMQFEIRVKTRGIYITVIDRGKTFNWKHFRTPNLNHYVDIGKKGGLGLWIIRKLTNKSGYKRTDRGNELYLVKFHSKQSAIERITKLVTSAKSVKEQFVLFTTLFILALMGGLYVFFVIQQQGSLRDKFLLYNAEIVKSIAETGKARIIKKNYLYIIKLLKEIKNNNENIDEIFIISPDGRIIAHNNASFLYREYRQGGNVIDEKNIDETMVLQYIDRYELVEPVFFKGREIGEVHLTIGKKGMKNVMSSRNINFLIVGPIVFAIAAIGIYLLLGLIIRPIQVLRAGVMAIGEGKLDHRIELDGEDEFSQIANAFNDMAIKFKGAQESLIEQERMQKEIQVAKEIQHTLLPKAVPETEGFDIASLYRSAKEVGGDYYDIMKVGRNLIGVIVADVSDKGVPAALIMTIMRTVMRLTAIQNKSAKSVMTKVNDYVKADMKKGMFVTAFYLVMDSFTRRINFVSAGHDPLILFRAKEDTVYYIKPKGFPLGISLPDEGLFKRVMVEESVRLKKDDLIAVYTDGITEAMNGKREQYGEKRFVEFLRQNGRLPAREIIEKLDMDIKEFTGGYPQNDDITIVIIKEKKTGASMLKKVEKQISAMKRKKMKIKDIEKELGISVKKFKKIKKEKGGKTEAEQMRFLTFEQKKELMELVIGKPGWSAKKYETVMRKKYGQAINEKVIKNELKRVNLQTAEKRKKYAGERKKQEET